MGLGRLLNWILGSGRPDGKARLSEEEPWAESASLPPRPYDPVASAELSAETGNPVEAESLFERAVEAYQMIEPDGLDFALGRYGDFLQQQGRTTEAQHVLGRAIDLGTDIPAVWNCAMRVAQDLGDFDEATSLFESALKRGLDTAFWPFLDMLAAKRDLPQLFDASTRAFQIAEYRDDRTSVLLAYADAASRSDDHDYGEAIARRVIMEADEENDTAKRWMAVGILGHALERAGNADEAARLWTGAFEKGSNDPVTANPLSMYLERRRKDYRGAAEVAAEALKRDLPANIEEQIRKRLDRCESKTTGRKRRDVAAYWIRYGAESVPEVFQARISPPARFLGSNGDRIRSFGTSKGVGTLFDLDAVTGEEKHRVEDLPDFSELKFSATGWATGLIRTAPVGQGPTRLWFMDAAGRIVGESKVPDATSEIALADDGWVVGCRAGLWGVEMENSTASQRSAGLDGNG